MDEQPDLFSYNAPPPMSGRELTQCLLGFCSQWNPSAMAVNVPLGCGNLKVNLAAFWRNNRKKLRPVEQSAVVVISDSLDKCFADSSLLDDIRAMREKKLRMEEEIRLCEPELASSDDLFGEFRTWDYQASGNGAYHKLCSRLEKSYRRLHQSGKLELIRESGMADFCYLAVPDDLVMPDDAATGWGLIYLSRNGRSRLVRNPELLPSVTVENRRLLAENMAMAAVIEVAFSFGVDIRADKSGVRFRKLPRRRGLLR